MSMNDKEPDPIPNERPAVWDLVIADMRSRDAFGRNHYGTPLQAFNGRNPLVDAYQEALDQSVYLRQAIEERKAMTKDITDLRAAIRWLLNACEPALRREVGTDGLARLRALLPPA
jgi:hypothetical protein